MTAINSAIEVDLTGQVCADSMGTRLYSGVGGQMDFMRGAALSPGGKPIIALPSTARQGTVSRIVPTLAAGCGRHDHAGACPLHRHRARGRVPAWQEHPRARGGADRHRPPRLSRRSPRLGGARALPLSFGRIFFWRGWGRMLRWRAGDIRRRRGDHARTTGLHGERVCLGLPRRPAFSQGSDPARAVDHWQHQRHGGAPGRHGAARGGSCGSGGAGDQSDQRRRR